MALMVYGAMMAAYAYYVWLLGHLGWDGRTRNPRASGRVIRFRQRAADGDGRGPKDETGDVLPAARLRAASGSRG